MPFVYKSVVFHNVLLIIISDIVFPSLIYFHQYGATALMHAAFNGHTEVVKLLLHAGALIEAKDTVSKRVSMCTCVRVCVCGGERGSNLPSYCMISVKYHIILLLYFITICRI